MDKMIDVPVVLHRQVPNVHAVHKNRGDSSSCSSSTKREHAEVSADGIENRRSFTGTAQ